MNRTDCDVSARAIIYGTLGFRATLEVTEHSRTSTFCSLLLPWLEQLGLGTQIEEFHREILQRRRTEICLASLRRKHIGEVKRLQFWDGHFKYSISRTWRTQLIPCSW